MSNKVSVVTGGAGFIGSHLCEKLLKLGHNVIAIDNLVCGHINNLNKCFKSKNFKLIKSSILNPKKIKPYCKKANYIFHLAGMSDIVPSIVKPKLYFDTNVTGTLNMLNIAKEIKNVKFIYSASSSCYGIPKVYPTKENSTISPKYPYALTKYMGEQLVKHWSNLYNISSISLRLFNVYGPRVRTTGHYGAMFGVFLAQKANNKPLTVVGDGNQSRDFTYVDDVVDAFIKALKITGKNNFDFFNIGYGKPIKINQIVKILNPTKVVHIPRRKGEPNVTHSDNSKFIKRTKWKPKINIKMGLLKLMVDIEKWKKAPVWDEKKIYFSTKEWFKFVKD